MEHEKYGMYFSL